MLLYFPAPMYVVVSARLIRARGFWHTSEESYNQRIHTTELEPVPFDLHGTLCVIIASSMVIYYHHLNNNTKKCKIKSLL